MSFAETVLAEIIGGLTSGLVVGFSLYLIFDKVLTKKPKLRLYIEPNEIKEREFILDFYIKNIGNLSAKDTIITMGFPDLDIIEEFFITGKHERIDHLRGNTATIQINCDKPIHPRDKFNQHIARIKLRLRGKEKEIEIRYDLEAENIDFFASTYSIKTKFRTN